MTEYDPARDALLSYEVGIRFMHIGYITGRHWIYEKGRWERAGEWLTRDECDLWRPATKHDVRALVADFGKVVRRRSINNRRPW